MKVSAAEIAGMIDHTLLKPDATPAQVGQLCDEAVEHNFCAVCVNPVNVSQVHERLQGSGVKTCSVVGFPLGAVTTEQKVFESRGAIADGAEEIDMVLNNGALKSGDDEAVFADVAAVAAACHAGGAILKVILETGLLSDDEKRRACKLCIEAKADFVKTSTGFGFGGATVEDISLMSNAVKAAGLGVKASGGVRDYAAACAMISAGTTRIGTSSGIAIVAEARAAE
ncbi:MAG: deoxyribose-phosphate aldolase [Verrucomicrobia bacterium]|nr:deoxyribose-phosphate aldolase [Verrucomicrobiota bacterium]